MKRIINKKSIFFAVISILIIGILAGPPIFKELRWRHNVKSVKAFTSGGGGMYLIGLNNVTLTPCVVSCNGGCCTGGTACNVLTVNDCPLTQEVSGSMAGGQMSFALLYTTDLAQAGVTAGGSIIGGLTSALMPSSPNKCIAGYGGCVGVCCSGYSVDGTVVDGVDVGVPF